MKKDPRVSVAQILESIDRIIAFTAGGRERFLSDRLIQDAVIRNFEIIGEAAKRLPEAYRSAHPSIPWRSLAGFRDVLIHQCDRIDPVEVWQVIQGQLVPVKEKIRSILPPLDQLERELAGEE